MYLAAAGVFMLVARSAIAAGIYFSSSANTKFLTTYIMEPRLWMLEYVLLFLTLSAETYVHIGNGGAVLPLL